MTHDPLGLAIAAAVLVFSVVAPLVALRPWRIAPGATLAQTIRVGLYVLIGLRLPQCHGCNSFDRTAPVGKMNVLAPPGWYCLRCLSSLQGESMQRFFKLKSDLSRALICEGFPDELVIDRDMWLCNDVVAKRITINAGVRVHLNGYRLIARDGMSRGAGSVLIC